MPLTKPHAASTWGSTQQREVGIAPPAKLVSCTRAQQQMSGPVAPALDWGRPSRQQTLSYSSRASTQKAYVRPCTEARSARNGGRRPQRDSSSPVDSLNRVD